MGGNIIRLQVLGYRLQRTATAEIVELATTHNLQPTTRVTEPAS